MRGRLQCYMWGWRDGWMGGMGLDGVQPSYIRMDFWFFVFVWFLLVLLIICKSPPTIRWNTWLETQSMTSVMNGPYTTHWPVQHTDESTVWTEICSAKIDLVLVFHFMSLLTSTSSLVTNLKKKNKSHLPSISALWPFALWGASLTNGVKILQNAMLHISLTGQTQDCNY